MKFFRQIRNNLFTENTPVSPSGGPDSPAGRFSKYMLYAIGEIALVMIGILLALQVNNWNESRKERVQEIKLYENLLVSLSADSTDVERIIKYISAGMEVQKFFISTSCEELIKNHSIDQLKDSLNIAAQIGTSFFPRYSAFNQLSNSGFQSLLQSEEIKTKLLDLYDRRYKRYLQIDTSIDEKAEFNLRGIISGDLQIFRDHNKVRPASAFDIKKFETYYPQLVREFSSILITADNAIDSLQNCQESIHELLSLIRAELEYLKT